MMRNIDLANALRFLSVDAVEKANSGHPGMPMGMADVATVLFKDFLHFDPAWATWPDRDRFVLSAGHGSMLLYALGYLTGYPDMTLEQIKNFRQLKSLTPGHPEVHIEAGIEMTTGPLGQGLSSAVGMALGERILNARFGDALVDHKTYVICSDGDLQEGITHESCALAGHWELRNLIVLYDSNDIQIDGATSLSFSENVEGRFLAYGWSVDRVDGHDPDQIHHALAMAQHADRPVLIICRTKIGYGAPNKAGTKEVHGSPLGKDEVNAARQKLGWAHPPFVIPDDILKAWRGIGKKGGSLSKVWRERSARHVEKDAFDSIIAATCLSHGNPQSCIPVKGGLEKLPQLIQELKDDFVAKKPDQATRKSSGDVLEKLVPEIDLLIGGSADLTPSNNTRVNGMKDVTPNDYAGNYIRYGVREHGMAAIMNGLALHGGFIPYSGTFLTFSDYARPAIRLAALMKQRVVHVMTHDSIGLGEDGPTHQPVEHLAALRAIPNVLVLRPCDGVEVAECWQLALSRHDGPSILALSRQNLPAVRMEASEHNLCALGGYVLRDSNPSPGSFHSPTSPTRGEVTERKAPSPPVGEAERAAFRGEGYVLIATGSEVSLAVAVFDKLKDKSIPARVVSMPCREIFMAQPVAYQAEILGSGKRVVIEAGIRQGWEGIMGPDGIFFGVESFGESAPYQDIYRHFGLTVENIVVTLMAQIPHG